MGKMYRVHGRPYRHQFACRRHGFWYTVEMFSATAEHARQIIIGRDNPERICEARGREAVAQDDCEAVGA